MNWIQNLNMTYENCKASIGYSDQKGQRPLLPICHITSQAHIEIAIDGEGNFLRARVISDKNDSTTIIPCSEGSGSRSGSKPETHPLCDKLQYVAGDFLAHGGTVTSGFEKSHENPFLQFLALLTVWCQSDFVHPKALAVLKYVKKKTVVEDLAAKEVLFIGTSGNFLRKDELKREKNSKDIFSVINSQEDAFVRWVVDIPGEEESRVWRDKSLWNSWIDFYLSTKNEKKFCFITGEEQVIANSHPKFIRREGDGAKLISSNDTSGFTFRGRFLTAGQACGIGLEASQKSHLVLAWLISRQGYKNGDLAILAWATSGVPVPQPTDDSITLLIGDAATEDDPNVYTAEEIAIPLKNKIAGYGKSIGETENIAVIAVDSATPGRLSITYYRELKGSDFLKRIDDWHTSCAWLHHYRDILDEISGKKKYIRFFGAPAPADIAEAVYGSHLDDKLRKTTVSRLLPCIVDGQPIPRDLVESSVRRASNRAGLEEWEWQKTLSIACALFKKFRQGKENFSMSLDETRTTRDYLYGRLLAIADILEERALYKSEQNRPTNAARYMQQFSQSPFRTWKQIHDSLTPYIQKLQGAHYYKNLIAEVQCLFSPEDFLSNKPLSGEYLLGYYCQRENLLTKKGSVHTTKDDENDLD